MVSKSPHKYRDFKIFLKIDQPAHLLIDKRATKLKNLRSVSCHTHHYTRR